MGKRLTEFIGREEELKLIDELVNEWGTLRLLYIDGPGGIGKTRLLQEVQRRYRGHEHLLIPNDLMDFANRSLHIGVNVGRWIATQFGKNWFSDYLREIDDLSQLEMAGVSQERQAEQVRRTIEIYLACHNRIAKQKRMIFLVDTMEALYNLDALGILVQMTLRTKNTLWIISGRGADKAYNSLAHYNVDTQTRRLCVLKPFSGKEADAYFEQTEIGEYIDDEMREKIRLLSNGRPVMIDLAIDWLEWQMPLPELVDMPVATLEFLANTKTDQWNKLQEEFEGELVRRIQSLAEPEDSIILDMAHLYHYFNADILSYLSGLSAQESKEALADLARLTFVKPKPEGEYALHDEMRRLVNQHVWPFIDPIGTERRDLDLRMASYYQQKLSQLEARLQAVREKLIKAETAGWMAEVFRLRDENLETENQKLLRQAELLFHTLRVDPLQGYQLFVELFDGTSRENRYVLAERMLSQITDNEFKDQFSGEERYGIEIRRVKYLLPQLRVAEGQEILHNLMADYADGGERELDMLTRLANCARLLGSLPQAIEYIERAVAICEAEAKIMAQWGGRIINTAGRMYRLMGKWDKAREYYRRSIDLLIGDRKNQAELAIAYNNIGYVIGLQSNYDSALKYSRRALRMQDPFDLKPDLARTHNTLGILYRGKMDYASSLKHTNQALDIFYSLEDEEWIAKVRAERGITRWYMGDLSQAKADLEKSYQICLEECLQIDLPQIMHAKARLAWQVEEIEQAEQLFHQSAEIGRQVSDYQQAVNSRQGLVELYYAIGCEHHKEGDFEKRDEWYGKAEAMAAQWKNEFEHKGYYFPLYAGSRQRILGNIAYDRADYERALQKYLDAYPRLATRGGYSKYMFPEELDLLQERIDQLPPQLALAWCDRIQEEWQKRDLARDFPEMITVCEISRDDAQWRIPIHEGDENA